MNQEQLFTVVLSKYEPLLKSSANRYALRGAFADAYAVAQLAFYEAFLNFDPAKGHFAPYAKRYVAGKLLHYVRKELRYQSQHVLPTYVDDKDYSWEEHIPAPDTVDTLGLSEELQRALTQLTARERLVILHYFVLDLPLEELAQLEGVTHSTVSTWKRRGLAKLRKLLPPDAWTM